MNIVARPLALAAILLAACSPALAKEKSVVPVQTPSTPPVAEARDHTVVHHGITISDPYAWLRDASYPTVDDADVLAYLNAENAWFEARMEPQKAVVETLFKELRGRIKEADTSVPQKDGAWLYWTEFEEGGEYRKWWRRPVDSPDDGSADELILDEPALAAGKEYFNLGAFFGKPERQAARLFGR